MRKCYAFEKAGRIYTLKPLSKKDGLPIVRLFRYAGYCDGQRCGFFKTKLDFEAFIQREPEIEPLGPHGADALRAMTWSQFEGNRILHKLLEGQKPKENP